MMTPPPIVSPRFTLERREHGWLLLAGTMGAESLGHALTREIRALMPPSAITNTGIAHSFRERGHSAALLGLGSRKEVSKWIQAINDELTHLPKEWRWWLGCDVGAEAATIFSALTDNPELSAKAAAFSTGSSPDTPDAYWQCRRLLAIFPEWRARLPEVPLLFPNSNWKMLVPLWDELSDLSAPQWDRFLRTMPHLE